MHNNGLDVTYVGNQVYTARQVVTNSKGQKVEVYWNYQAFEDLANVPVGYAPVMEQNEIHWEIFLWGETPARALIDFDLGVPNTWFEYEEEMWNDQCFMEDQMTIPEGIRRFPTEKNPHCNKDLWKSQDALDEIEDMKRPDWTPRNIPFNVYGDPNFKAQFDSIQENDQRK